jgi:MFS family permease
LPFPLFWLLLRQKAWSADGALEFELPLMRAYISFLKGNLHPVFFGWMLTFFSSFGQTFFISLFVPSILYQFGLSKSAFGGYYAVATVVASFFLLLYGHKVDSHPLKPFTLKTILLLTVSCVLLAAAVHPAMVFVALIGLRLGGQGLMSHISLSVMSRHFTADRGKALSISSLGYPMGEMVFPLVIGIILSLFNWQIAMLFAASLLVIVLATVKQFDLESYDVPEVKKEQPDGGKWRYFREIISEKSFLILILPVFTFTFVSTGVFFFQYVLAAERQWPLEWYAMCFAGYAMVRFSFVLFGGLLTDRFSARKLFPYYLIPLILGLLALAGIQGKLAALLFLLLIGVTAGTSSIVSSAVIAELYGTARVGQVRSLFSMFMVLSSALAPLSFGYFLDHGVTMGQIAVGCTLFLTLVTLHSQRIRFLKS